MYFALELFVIVLFLSLSVIIVCGSIYIVQLITERFIVVTLPVITKLYGAIRYPHLFKSE